MRWTDEGIVLGSRRHGEANAILELMTREHGRHLGLVRGGAASRLRRCCRPGNRVSACWQARLDEHLGHYTVEVLNARAAALLPIPHALYGLTHLASLCRLLPERDPHPQVHAALAYIIESCPMRLVRARASCCFELQLVGGARFRPRSCQLCSKRRAGRPDLCLAEIGACSLAAGRRAMEGQAAGVAGVPSGSSGEETGSSMNRRPDLLSPAFFSCAMCSSRVA